MDAEAPKDGCSWCGDDEPSRVLGSGPPHWFRNRREETFCCRAHMNASAAALRQLQGREPEPPPEVKPQAGAFVTGDVVEVMNDSPEVEERYPGWTGGLWTVGLIFKTTEGLMATLTRVGQRRNVPTADLRRAELPPALR